MTACDTCGSENTERVSSYPQAGQPTRKYRKCRDCERRFVVVEGEAVDKRNHPLDREEPWYMEGAFE